MSRVFQSRNAIAVFKTCLPALIALVCTVPARGDDATRTQVSRERVVGQTAIPVYRYKVMRTYPHDPTAYTEGLVMQDGSMYEGTGLYGLSRLRQYDLASGRVIHEQRLDKKYFGEGVTVLNGTIYQLTYLSNIGFTNDQVTFA